MASINRSAALVTGGTGFIGQHLVKLLIDKNWDVKVPVRPGTEVVVRAENIRLVPADLLDGEAVRAAAEGADVLFHLGGSASVRLSQKRPNEVIRVNTVGTRNSLEAARLGHVKRFVY